MILGFKSLRIHIRYLRINLNPLYILRLYIGF